MNNIDRLFYLKTTPMKKYFIIAIVVLFHGSIFSQSSFCDGWVEGYESGMKSISRNTFIVPICPTGSQSRTYEDGYNLGYEKATGRSVSVVPAPDNDSDDFCNGWESGYTNEMNEDDKFHFIVPNCPIPRIGNDSFDAGYLLGRNRALAKMGKQDNDIIVIDNDGSFCDGWERGYQLGLQIWANENGERTPRKLTPICPIPKVNRDGYSDGFERGKQKAIMKMSI